MKRNRFYQKAPVTRDDKLFFLFTEGAVTEPIYFQYFNKEISQIILQPLPLPAGGNNSPAGLYEEACRVLVKTTDNPDPEYDCRLDDEVWFVVDTDSWGAHLPALRLSIAAHPNWHIAQSNPCFELWLYYHYHSQPPGSVVENWKTFLGTSIPGGFDARKHPARLLHAIHNAENNYTETAGVPHSLCTQVFRLAKAFLPLVEQKIKLLPVMPKAKE